MYSNPKYPGRRTPRCPHPGCPANDEPWIDPWEASQCTLNKPLLMVIPAEGIHLPCPVHPEGHHIYGSGITWCDNNLPDPSNNPMCDYQHDSSKDLTYDSTRPYGTTTGSNIRGRTWRTGTGFIGNDTFKFSM